MAVRQSRRQRAKAEPKCQAAYSKAFTVCSIGEISAAGSVMGAGAGSEFRDFLAKERLLNCHFQTVIYCINLANQGSRIALRLKLPSFCCSMASPIEPSVCLLRSAS